MSTFNCRLTLALLAAAVFASGCANYMAPFETTAAHPGIETRAGAELRRLPPPEEKVVVAVYRFRDQTGQYKQAENMASWSTAVTQGSTSILMRALEESGWFAPIEREGLSNLLNERQIIQSIRAQHTGPNGEPLGPLPPLLYAGVILEGGIIGYDTNVITGGAGVRYFGAGAAGQFRQDQVTVYLRAVSTQSGRVLKTVYSTKTIISQKVDAGLFRYVDANRLLETEAGYTFNEPPVLAVTEAIEESVKSLIIEGVRENMWALQNPNDANSEAFAEYDAKVDETAALSYFGRPTGSYRSFAGVGVQMGTQRYQGNYRDPLMRPVGSLDATVRVTDRLFGLIDASVGGIAARGAFSRVQGKFGLGMRYLWMPNERFTPYVTAGVGLLVQNEWKQGFGDGMFTFVGAGGGVEYMLTPSLGISLGYRFDYMLQDGLDGVQQGKLNDSVWGVQTGITYYPRWW